MTKATLEDGICSCQWAGFPFPQEDSGCTGGWVPTQVHVQTHTQAHLPCSSWVFISLGLVCLHFHSPNFFIWFLFSFLFVLFVCFLKSLFSLNSFSSSPS